MKKIATTTNVTVNTVENKEEITMSKKEVINEARSIAVEIAKDLYGEDLDARLAGVGESLATWEPEKVTKTFVYFAMDDPWSDGEIGNDLEVRVRRENLEVQYRLYHFFCDEPEDNGWTTWSKWVPLDSDEYVIDIPADKCLNDVVATDEEMAEDFKADMIAAAIDAAKASVSVGDLEITKDNAPDIEEPVEKGGDDMKVRNRRLLLNLLCYRWVAESRLFYKSNKYREEGGDFYFIASRKRQLGVTCKCLKDLGWQANPATLDRVAEILREEGITVSATRDVYIPSAIWDKFTKGKAFLDKRKGDKDIITYLKEVI